MTCDEAYQRMLEADPEELQGEMDSPVSLHLRSCGRCRAVADRILRDEENLRGMLSAVRSRIPPEDASKRAAWEARLRHRRRVWYGLAPVAAAAGLAGIVLMSSGGPAPGSFGDAVVVPPKAPPPIVEAAPGQRVAVIETDNPHIVVVWSF